MTWAGAYSSSQLTCGGQYTPGSLSAAYYSTGHTYDNLDRLTSATGTGGAGTYTYGDSSHLHGVTSTTSSYSATYDVAGDMTCRALTSATTCAGSTPTGQKLTYDSEGRLTGWQNTWTAPATTANDAYDGEGNRVAQRVTSGGTTTTTDYIAGGLEEQTGSTLTKYESVPGVIGVVIVGTGSSESVSYLATDGLGSVSEAFDGRGNVLGAQLYGPFGGVRYSSGTMPTARGYTGQYADAASSGLDYYGARYYDPVVGQFTGADTVLAGGLNRYAYMGNNPETATDLSGHIPVFAWWSPNSIWWSTVTDSALNKIIDDVYGHGGDVGPNFSTFDALRREALFGEPTHGKWHFIKTQATIKRLRDWLKANGGTADPNDVEAENAMWLDATDARAAALASPHSSLIQGTPAYKAAQAASSASASSGTGSGTAGSGSGGSSPSGTITPNPTSTGTDSTSTGPTTAGDNQQIQGNDAQAAGPTAAQELQQLEVETARLGAAEAEIGPFSAPQIMPPPPPSSAASSADSPPPDDPISQFEEEPWWMQLIQDAADDGE